MRQHILAVLLVSSGALVAASCGSSTVAAPTFDRIPTAIAYDWLNAVEASDAEAISAVVEPNGLVMVAAAENAYTLEEIASLLTTGMTAELAHAYWQGFRDEFTGFSTTVFEDLEVGVFEEFSVDGVAYAVVTLRSPDGNGTVVVSGGPSGWRIDMPATVGPAFANQIRRIAEGLDDTPAAVIVMSALVGDVVPGLRAAAQLDPQNTELARELALLEGLLPSELASVDG